MSQESKVDLVCRNLEKYYKYFNRDYDKLFSIFCVDNGIDDEGLGNELNEKASDAIIIDFDIDNFPFPGNAQNKPQFILDLLERCYRDRHIVPVALPTFNSDFFNITANDLNSMKQIMKTQCPKLFTQAMSNDDNLIKLLAIGYKNEFDYFHHLVDSWFRHKIKNETCEPNKAALPISNWMENNKHFAMLKKIKVTQTETAYDVTAAAVNSFFNRICPQLMLRPLVKINDSLEVTVKYIEAGCTFIATLMDEASPLKTMRAICPFQFDLCIASGEPANYNDIDDDDDDDDDDDEKCENKFIDTVGDIEQKLKKNKLRYKSEVTTPGKIEQQRVFIKLFNEMEVKSNASDSIHSKNEDKFYHLHKKRLIALVDRRKAAVNNGDPIYLYRPPANCARLENDAVTASYISLSRTCLLPNLEYGDGAEALLEAEVVCNDTYNKNKNTNISASFHCGGCLLTFSFHVKKEDEIKLYLYWNGQVIRFMPQDIKTVLPLLFNMEIPENREFIEGKREMNERINEMNRTLKDIDFEAFQRTCI